MTSLRAELFRTLVVLSAPLGAAAIFPYEAIGFAARNAPPPSRPYVAFVHLTDAERETALRAAKSAWEMESAVLPGEQTWLPLGELPEEAPGPILPSVPPRRKSDAGPRVAYPAPAWMPSAGAPPPVRIAKDPEEPAPSFPRAELLQLP